MRFKRHINPEYGLVQIEITPLINIVFQLLLFFMLGSSFLTQPALRVDLPRAVTSDAVRNENIEVSISAENIIYFKGRVMTDRQLEGLFKAAARRAQSLLISADRRASLGRVVRIWDMARDLGIAELNIATDKEQSAR